MSKKDEALKLAEDALKRVRTQDMELVQMSMIALAAIREALAEQPAQQEPVAWADECRISLVTAIHFLASDYENALGVFRDDTEARRKAEGDIAYARKIAAKWNWNGTSPPAQRKPLTRKQLADAWIGTAHITHATERQIAYARAIEAAHAIEAKLKEKNA